MRIETIKVYRLDLPVKGEPYRMARSELTSLDSTVVEVTTDTGISGFGETCPLGSTYQDHHAGGARAALAEIGPPLIGLDPTLVDLVYGRMHSSLRGHLYAKAAIDIACWDVAARAQDRRVSDLLGGARRERVPSYRVVGPGTPDDTVESAVTRESEGWQRLQIKVGGRDVGDDIAALLAVAGALDDRTAIVADANRGWSTGDAVLASEACRDIPMIIEQPCATYAECLMLRGRLHHPVFLDEVIDGLDMVVTAIGDGAADGFGLKLTRVGGITPMRAIRDLCRTRGVPHTVDDAWGSDVIAAACVQVAATVDPDVHAGTWIADPYIDGHLDRNGGIEVVGGWIDLPDGPGLGVVPDRDRLGEPVSVFS